MSATDSTQAHIDNITPHMDHRRDISSEMAQRYVSVVIEDTVVHAFIDTGADISVVSEDFRKATASLYKRPVMQQFIPLTGVTGDPLDSIGSISVNLSIAHQAMTHTLQVVRNCTKPLILGWDFLVTNGKRQDSYRRRECSAISEPKTVCPQSYRCYRVIHSHRSCIF